MRGQWSILLPILLFPAVVFAKSSLTTQKQVVPKVLPQAPTSVHIQKTTGSPLTAGDIFELEVSPLLKSPTQTDIMPNVADKLKEGPVAWGQGRILWWKEYDPVKHIVILGLTSYTPGKYEIAPIPFSVAGKPAFTTQPQVIEFSSLGGDKSKDDIYPPLGIEMPRWVWIVLGVLGLLILGLFIYFVRWLLRRRKMKKITQIRTAKILTPQEEFEKTKDLTLQRGFLSKQQYKPHYFALSDASKRFLGKAFRFEAEERTTRELIRELQDLGLSENLTQQWQRIFDEMDVTKFTDQLPDQKNAQALAPNLSALVAASYRVSPVARDALAALQKGGK